MKSHIITHTDKEKPPHKKSCDQVKQKSKAVQNVEKTFPGSS